MANSIKKRGQKLLRRFSRASAKASEEGREHLRENFLGRWSHIQNIRLLILEWVLMVAALIMLAVTQAFWFNSSYAKDEFTAGGTYTEATIGRVNSMNPLFATTSSERVLSRLMFSTLVAMDYTGQPGVGLADYIRASDNGKVWTLKLREGLKWSDGEPLTNEDVLFTVDLIQNPAVNTIYNSNLENVKVTENADGTIMFTLPAAYTDFATALEIPVVPKHILADAPVKTLVEDDFSNAPVTSGAFAFNALQTTSADDEEVFYLSANPYYYLGRPLLNTFAVHTYTTKDEVAAAVNTGSVTATAELAGEEVGKVTSGSFEKRETPVAAGAFIFFNTSSNLLKNTTLRRGIRLGLDMEALRAAAPGTEALNYPLLDSQITLSKYPELPSYNFDLAEATVSEFSGDEVLTINVTTVRTGYLPAVAEVLAKQLEALGFEVNLTIYDETQDFIANIVGRRNYDILVYEVEMGADADPLPYYHSSQASAAGLNLSNYRNTLVDDLLVGARETLDATLRARKYENFLEYWVTDAPAVGLYQANMTYIYNHNVRCYSEDIKLTTVVDRFVDVKNWAAAQGITNLTP